MKTRARLVLEKRFRQMANGKTLAAFSAAALLGLRLTAQSAEAAVINPCLAAYGGGTPTVDVFVNDQFVETLHLSSLVDSQGNRYIDLTSGGGGTGTYTSLDGGSFTIFAIPDGRPDPPRVFLDPGSGGVSLLVATDMLVSADLLGSGLRGGLPVPTGKLSLALDSRDSYGTCPGGTHTYGITMDGAALGANPTAKVEVTGEAVIRTFESSDVINVIPPGAADVGPSLAAGTPTAPLKAGGLFTGAVTESLACGTTGLLNCPLQLRNTITLTFAIAGDLLYASGSFGAAAAVEPGDKQALVLGATGVPFDTFTATVASQPVRNTFEVRALLKLGALSDGIDPPAEKFSMRIGDFAATLDPGSFVARRRVREQRDDDDDARADTTDATQTGGPRLDVIYTFNGFVGGLPFKAVIIPLFGNKVSVLAAGHGADLHPGTAILDLAIGNDKGTTPAKVFNGERARHADQDRRDHQRGPEDDEQRERDLPR